MADCAKVDERQSLNLAGCAKKNWLSQWQAKPWRLGWVNGRLASDRLCQLFWLGKECLCQIFCRTLNVLTLGILAGCAKTLAQRQILTLDKKTLEKVQSDFDQKKLKRIFYSSHVYWVEHRFFGRVLEWFVPKCEGWYTVIAAIWLPMLSSSACQRFWLVSAK